MQCGCILIVEDDEAIRDALRMMLEIEGYQVFTAENGKDALDVLAGMPVPCLILLDLMMPVMDGWAFAEVLEKDMILAAIPVVVVTAFSEKAGTPGKARKVLKKPIDMNALWNVARQYCA